MNEKPFSVDMSISNNTEDTYLKKLQNIVKNRENDEDYKHRVECSREMNERPDSNRQIKDFEMPI